MGVAPANGSVLKWARDERRLTIEVAAEKLGLTVPELQAIENGTKTVTVTDLRDIAKKYQISFASLLMPEPLPISTRPKVQDFRTREGLGALYDHDLVVELEAVNEQLDMLAELRDDFPALFGETKLDLAKLSDDAELLAGKQRAAFGIELVAQLGWPTERFAFLTLRAHIEARGIFVQARNLGPPKNCRGFSLLDERNIAAIVVNSNKEEEYGPRNFTLMHEYAHLLLRETGISDENRVNRVEKFCNRFAAFFLMPRTAFVDEAKQMQVTKWTESAVGKIAKRFKVSKSAAAIQLEDTGLAPKGLYDELRKGWESREKKARKGGLPTEYADKMVNRQGVRHVRIVMTALDARRISPLDAYEMLDVAEKHFGGLVREMRERMAVYGGG